LLPAPPGPASLAADPPSAVLWEIDLTDNGFSPAGVSIQPGDSVRWTNPTASPQMLRSGLPRRLYLPLVAGPTGAGAGTAAESRPAVSPAVHGEFAVSLAPGGQTLAQKSSGCI